jgi:hypothetical protein
MSFNADGLFDKPAFTALGPERLHLIKNFARDIENKKGPEIAALYLRLNQSLSKIKPLSKSERSSVAEAIRESLPEENRIKFEQILKMIPR